MCSWHTVTGVTVEDNVIESGGTAGIYLCHGCQSNTADNNVLVLRPVAIYDQGALGTSNATGDMNYNGKTRIDLLPSYFPSSAATSSIAVQLSGTASEGASAQFDVLADGSVIGSGTATSSIADCVFKVALAPHQVHRIKVQLMNGVDNGTPTTSLHSLNLFVNNTAVSLSAGGEEGILAANDDLNPTNFSITLATLSIELAGDATDLFDDNSDGAESSYVDPNPGTIDYNVLFQGVSKASDPIFGNQPLDPHSVQADPLFNNPSVGDYTLQSNSPCIWHGLHNQRRPPWYRSRFVGSVCCVALRCGDFCVRRVASE